MPPRSLILLTLATLALAGCGRRGELEFPVSQARTPAHAVSVRAAPVAAVPDAAAATEVTSARVGSNVLLDPSSPGAQEPEVTRRDLPLPQRRFILDPLL